MSPAQIFHVALLRWRLMFFVVVTVVCAVTAYSLRLPKNYVAEASLLLDSRPDPLVNAYMPAMGSPAYMSTQIEIIKSDAVASRVVQLLSLREQPTLMAKWNEETKGRISFDAYASQMLGRGLTVEAVRGSNILSVSYADINPRFAADAANAFVRAYLDQSLDLRVEPARQYVRFFDERLKALRTEYEAAQARVSAFQRERGLIVSETRVDQETARLNTLTEQLIAAQVGASDANGRQRASNGESPQMMVAQHPLIVGLRAELTRAEARLVELDSQLGVNNPKRVQQVAQIEQLKAQLASDTVRLSAETSLAVASVDQRATRLSSGKVAELRAMVEAQKKTVLDMRALYDEISVLQKDVETSQKAYQAVAQQRSQVTLQSQVTQDSARLLGAAVEPLWPSKPNVKKNVAASLGAGIALAIALAVGLELLDRRIRSPADLSAGNQPALLAVLSPGAGETAYWWPQSLARPISDAPATLALSGPSETGR